MTDEEFPAVPQPKKAVLRTPDEWAQALGHMKPRRLEISMYGVSPGLRVSSEHRRAATQHGWDMGAMRGDRPVSLTKEGYLAALAAATVGESHEPALAPCRRN